MILQPDQILPTAIVGGFTLLGLGAMLYASIANWARRREKRREGEARGFEVRVRRKG